MNERMQQKMHHCIAKLLSRTTEGMQYLVKIAAARLGTKKVRSRLPEQRLVDTGLSTGSSPRNNYEKRESMACNDKE